MARYNLLAVALIGATLVMGNPLITILPTTTTTITTTTTYPTIHTSHYGPESAKNPIYLSPIEETKKQETISPINRTVPKNNDPPISSTSKKISPVDKLPHLNPKPSAIPRQISPVDGMIHLNNNHDNTSNRALPPLPTTSPVSNMIHKNTDPTLTPTGQKVSPVDGMPHLSSTNNPQQQQQQPQPRSDIMDAFHHFDDLMHPGQNSNPPAPTPTCPDDGLPRDPATCQIHANFADPNYPDIIVDGKLDEALKQMPKLVPDRPSVNAPPPVTEREKVEKVEKIEKIEKREALVEVRKVPVWKTKTRTATFTKTGDSNGNGMIYSRPTVPATMTRKRRTVQALPTDVVN